MRCPNAFSGLPVVEIIFGACYGAEAFWIPDASGGRPFIFFGDKTLFKTNKTISGQDAITGMGQRGPRGVADQMYDTKRRSRLSPSRWLPELSGKYADSKYHEKATAVITHELGHIIHGCKNVSRNTFWENKRVGAPLVPLNIAINVSSYTYNNNFNEFVAEVFTGLICGKNYPREVIDLYNELHGPLIMGI